MTKTILITGATSGFGAALARKLSQNPCQLIITGRRKSRLDALKTELEQQPGVRVLALNFDVNNRQDCETQIQNIPEDFKPVDILVNNAGLASGLNPLHEGLFEDWDKMLDTNIKGILNMTRFIAPMMIERGSGHIINVGSIAGKEVYPNGNVYCASKHAVDALTKGMRQDFLPYGIKVSQICPGAADTEFSKVRFKGDDERAAQVYKGYKPLTAEDVADIMIFMINQPSHVCINDLVVTCTAQASGTLFCKNFS